MSLSTKAQFDRLTVTRQTHVTGATRTLADAKGPIQLIVNPASTLSALAVTFPPAPFDNQVVNISFGGTMTSGVAVTAMSVVANTNQGVIETNAPGSSSVGRTIAYRYNASNSKWYRMY